MESNKKIKAFTLSEMIVVLILTSIVIGLAFSMLNLVQKQLSAIQNNYHKSLELNKLETSLWLDFNRYSDIHFNELDNELSFSNELNSISYTFNEQFIIKEQDTFLIKLDSKQFYFDGISSTSNKVDAIKLKTAKEFLNRELFIFKKNDATTYMD